MAADLVIIMGPPGAGKGTQSKLLAQRLGGVHISSGEVLRNANDPELAKVMNAGGLVPSEDVCRLVGESIKAVSVERPIVLDGFTRMIGEAQWLQEQLPQLERSIKAVVMLSVDANEGKERNLARGRGDDEIASQQKRWELYYQETEPVLNFYKQQGVLKEVDGVGSIEEVAKRVWEAIYG